MTPFVCRTLEEHQTRTAEVQREREKMIDALARAEVGLHAKGDKTGADMLRRCALWATLAELAFPLPVLAPQGVRGKRGTIFHVDRDGTVRFWWSRQPHGDDPLSFEKAREKMELYPGEVQAAALALLGAEGLADLVVGVLSEKGCWMAPEAYHDGLRRRIVELWPALCAKAGA